MDSLASLHLSMCCRVLPLGCCVLLLRCCARLSDVSQVEQSALKAGIPPQEFVDQVSQNFEAMGEALHISNDR